MFTLVEFFLAQRVAPESAAQRLLRATAGESAESAAITRSAAVPQVASLL